MNDRYKLLWGVLILVLLIGLYQIFTNEKIKSNGIYTKCIILDIDGRKGGVMITLKYNYRGKEYKGRMGTQLGSGSIGKQYFIKFLPNKPDEIILLEMSPVPACLLNTDAPEDGWQELPSCE
ncbi:hypothetical protein [Flavihumibacter sp. ZG627]|uniref:hypothetical protein n=1 Tax=Flavihumibacter sp. ZG627 TaxID=1463156 RepID=UPI00057CEF8E|nr:hypothetical protein [Flavihumibacter sp. ZG627]KIC89058.1 hypothetical protein HY58_18930 [Flavihumibacter sp. ZG627]